MHGARLFDVGRGLVPSVETQNCQLHNQPIRGAVYPYAAAALRAPSNTWAMAGVLQLIDSKGVFNGPGLDAFIQAVDLSSCGLSYAVVSIMGPQSSGKSTLLNHLFSTRFTEMNALSGRSQTTQGVWLARASGIDPCTLIMDLEGTDGTERGEDDTAFEKQSSLFALAVSDIVLINMWCHDIGREHAANKPLLKTVFQVMMRLFTPRRTTLLFVIRDKTRTPLEVLDSSLRREVQKIWDSVPKPEMHRETPLTEFFNIAVTALSNYEDKEEQFKAEVAQLRQRFFNSIAPGGLAGDRQGVVPGTGFSVSTQAIWRVVKENKDLDLPTHKVMVATVRCDAIAAEKIAKLGADKEWLDLYEHSMQGPISGFGEKATKLLVDQITGYDQEAAYFEESVRGAKRDELLSHILDMFQPAQKALVGHHRGRAFSRFKQDLAAAVAQPDGTQHFAASVRGCAADAMTDFERGSADALIRCTGWQKVQGSFKLSKIREQLRADLEGHAASVRSEKLAELISGAQKRLEHVLVIPTASLLQAGSPEAWSSIRNLLAQQTDNAVRDLSAALTGFEMDKEEEFTILADLKDFATSIVKRKAQGEAGNALAHMNYRFNHIFSQDADGIPRVWSAQDDVKAITREARWAALKLLSVLAALRLEEGVDEVEAALSQLLGDSSAEPSVSGSKASPDLEVSDVLSASTWEGISSESTLITPVQCKALWRQFKSDTQYAISQAVLAQEANKQRNRSSLPPMWAILAMMILGFNEFMTLLRNPLYLGIIFISYLFGKAVWVQLDIAREFEAGLVPGIISVTSKLLPTLMKILKKLAEEGQQRAGDTETNRARPGGHSAGLSPAHSSNTTVSTVSNGIEPPSSALRQRQHASALST